jgi:hypothetical protein
MKKAETINEFANVISPLIDITKDVNSDMYVDIYKDIKDALRDKLLFDSYMPHETLFVSGQSGTGKTTALRFLPDDELKAAFHIRFIDMHLYLDDGDTDIIDFMLLLGYDLVKDHDNLKFKYIEELVRIHDVNEGSREVVKETTGSDKLEAGGGAKSSAGFNWAGLLKSDINFFANYKKEKVFKETTREVFKVKKSKLVELINQLILDFTEANVEAGKQLLLIIDGPDRLRDVPGINSIFKDSFSDLTSLKCKKVIVIPPHLHTDKFPFYKDMTTYFFRIKLYENPIDDRKVEKERKEIEKYKDQMKEVVARRTMPGANLIDANALDMAIEYSGGILRQFLTILHEAAAKTRLQKAATISVKEVEETIEQFGNTRSGSIIMTSKMPILYNIMNRKFEVNNEGTDFIDLFLSEMIIPCTNGIVWYEVNPLVRKTVEIYGKPSSAAE